MGNDTLKLAKVGSFTNGFGLLELEGRGGGGCLVGGGGGGGAGGGVGSQRVLAGSSLPHAVVV